MNQARRLPQREERGAYWLLPGGKSTFSAYCAARMIASNTEIKVGYCYGRRGITGPGRDSVTATIEW
jgi:hypothetical protein